MNTPDNLEALISAPRFQTYVNMCNGDKAQAVELYHWTGEVSGALLTDFRVLEVLFRNLIDSAIDDYVKTNHSQMVGEWIDNDSWIPPAGYWWDREAQRAIDQARRRVHDRNPTRGQIVAELMFGFWRYVISGRYEESFWIPILDHAFTDIPGHAPGDRRRTLEESLIVLNKLRNRLAHHEPICRPWTFQFRRGRTEVMSLDTQYKHLLQVVDWIDPTATTWITSNTRMLELLNRRP